MGVTRRDLVRRGEFRQERGWELVVHELILAQHRDPLIEAQTPAAGEIAAPADDGCAGTCSVACVIANGGIEAAAGLESQFVEKPLMLVVVVLLSCACCRRRGCRRLSRRVGGQRRIGRFEGAGFSGRGEGRRAGCGDGRCCGLGVRLSDSQHRRESENTYTESE